MALCLFIDLSYPLCLGGQFYVMHLAPSNFSKSTSSSIATRANLVAALGISDAELSDVLDLSDDERYKRIVKHKPNGEERIVFNPTKSVRKIQRRIKNRIFKKIVEWPDFVFGSIPKKKDKPATDYVACAGKHNNSKSILKIDMKSFFDNVHENIVYKIYNNFFKYPIEVSKILTNISCRNGSLCQGALTSSYLATLALYDVELAMVEKLKRKKLIYTRYVDDITVSSKEKDYDFSYALNIIEQVLNSKELPINKTKTIVAHTGSEALLVHGLRVNTETTRLPTEEIRRIRAGVKNLEIVAAEDGYRWSLSYRREYYKHLGRVYKLKRLGHQQYEKLLQRMNEIYPKPSRNDLRITLRLIRKIKDTFASEKEGFWFRRRYYVAIARLNFLGESKKYKRKVEVLRRYVNKFKPLSIE